MIAFQLRAVHTWACVHMALTYIHTRASRRDQGGPSQVCDYPIMMHKSSIIVAAITRFASCEKGTRLYCNHFSVWEHQVGIVFFLLGKNHFATFNYHKSQFFLS